MPGFGAGAASATRKFMLFSWGPAAVAAVMLLSAYPARADDNGNGNGNGKNGNPEEHFTRIATIQIPGAPLKAFDISWFEPRLSAYLLADRSNAALDVVDTKNNTVLFQVGGFAGVAASCASPSVNDCSGPDGVVTVDAKEAWVGDGNSTVKVVDLSKRAITDTISTGGMFRADELSWDSKDGIILVANDADNPPFVTFISTKSGHKVLGSLKFPTATNGLEQSQWWSKTGMFYLSVPEVGGVAGHGEIAVINPKTMKVVQTFPLSCEPAGLAIGPENFALVGCSDGPVQEVNLRSGATVKTFAQVGHADEVWFNPGDGHFLAAAGNNVSGGNPAPVLGILDAQTKKFDQDIKTQVGDHSVAADSIRNHVFLPNVPNPNDTKCTNGCVIVYACTAGRSGGEGDAPGKHGKPTSCQGQDDGGGEGD